MFLQRDLDFLLMKLYVADSGHGQVFKDVQTNKELNNMIENDQEIIHVTLRVRSDMLKQKCKTFNIEIRMAFNIRLRNYIFCCSAGKR